MRSVEINALDIQVGDSIPCFGRFIEDNEVTHVMDETAYTPLGAYALRDETIIVFRD